MNCEFVGLGKILSPTLPWSFFILYCEILRIYYKLIISFNHILWPRNWPTHNLFFFPFFLTIQGGAAQVRWRTNLKGRGFLVNEFIRLKGWRCSILCVSVGNVFRHVIYSLWCVQQSCECNVWSRLTNRIVPTDFHLKPGRGWICKSCFSRHSCF
jgi:hypothetical protein